MLSESSNYAYNEEFLELKQVTISMRLVTRMKMKIKDEDKFDHDEGMNHCYVGGTEAREHRWRADTQQVTFESITDLYITYAIAS